MRCLARAQIARRHSLPFASVTGVRIARRHSLPFESVTVRRGYTGRARKQALGDGRRIERRDVVSEVGGDGAKVERLAGRVAVVKEDPVVDRDVTGAERVDRLRTPGAKPGRRARLAGRRETVETRRAAVRRVDRVARARHAQIAFAAFAVADDPAWSAASSSQTRRTARTPSSSSATETTSGGENRSTRSPAAVRSTPFS